MVLLISFPPNVKKCRKNKRDSYWHSLMNPCLESLYCIEDTGKLGVWLPPALETLETLLNEPERHLKGPDYPTP